MEITSCGLNGGPLRGEGEYPAYIACNLFTKEACTLSGDPSKPKITQDGCDGDEVDGHIANIEDGTTIGFKYFQCKGVVSVAVTTRGYAHGAFDVRIAWDGETLGSIPVDSTNGWEAYQADIQIPDGKQAIYLVYRGKGPVMLKSFALITN